MFKKPKFIAIAISLLWLAILHRPALLSFGNAIPGRVQSDAIRGQWSAWATANDIWGIETHLVNFPEGAALLPLPPLSLVIVSPMTSLFGANIGIVSLVMLHAILAIAGGFFLARAVGLSKWPALSCGLFLSAAPMMGEALSVGVYECLTIGWSAFCLGALVKACRGDGWQWGPAAGILYLLSVIESGYLGSALALSTIVVSCMFLRSYKGLLSAALAAVVVAAGAWALSVALAPVLDKFSTESIEAGGFRVSMGIAELKAIIPGFSPPPPPPGDPEPFRSAPPLFVVVFFTGAWIATWRKSSWAAGLGLAFLLIAIHSSIMSWWIDSPLGEFVKYLRRMALPMAMMMGLVIAYGLEWLIEKKPGKQGLQALVAISGVTLISSSWGLLTGYPLLWTPVTPQFAIDIQEDPMEGALIVVPQEQPEKAQTYNQNHLSLKKNTSFSNPQARLWFQTLIDRPVRHHSKLSTLIPKSEGRPLSLDRGVISRQEVESLKEKGLRYLLLDNEALGRQALGKAKKTLDQMGHKCRHYDEWGGIDVCRMDGRIKADPAPSGGL